MARILSLLNMNEWKRYRKVSAPAFTEANNKLVWTESIRVMEDLFQTVWGDRKEIMYDDALYMTVPATLLVIGAAGFGRCIRWNDELVLPAGHKMTFKDALSTVSRAAIFKASIPNWMMHLTKRGRNILQAYEELETYMMEMIPVSSSIGNKGHSA
ncbi:hypothetical protein QCA50_009789 [Cerrena zonata]|uniref:Cytochrome P450 n=1 Tax=Cerrena zonata TaxID=2478898 RepID=A0AAW0G6E8_9APHY